MNQSIAIKSTYEVHQKNIADLNKQIMQLESTLAQKAEVFKESKRLEKLSIKDITNNLHVNELYIDFAKVGNYMYIFSVDEKETVTFTQLSEEKSKKIHTLMKRFRNVIEDADDKSLSYLQTLYSLLFPQELQEAMLTKSTLIISADASLRLLPFEALRLKDSRYLIQDKEIHYIPSAKEYVRLHRFHDKSTATKVVLFSNPDFDSSDTISLHVRSRKEIVDAYLNPEFEIQRALFTMYFSPLSGTKYEAESITKLLKKSEVKNYTLRQASEANLLHVKDAKILHIASHGFFLNDASITNTMLQSGITLAGANASAENGRGEGIITSLKIAGMNLKGCDLVVLSACETGVVDMNSTQSVSGLNKAFMQAGTKDMLLSLWSVSDKETANLMIDFYTHIKDSPSYSIALRKSKLKMIKEHKHPFYWSAFVLSGL